MTAFLVINVNMTTESTESKRIEANHPYEAIRATFDPDVHESDVKQITDWMWSYTTHYDDKMWTHTTHYDDKIMTIVHQV